ncbi:hypothetical protein Aple_006530 [Acrocarpospora pleiomorpha]|uniref:DUF1593 domain-containing protein n=1 Tax=Acrocarpospora pleiomorpha TaxID=90975 RepID=A0A5M3XI96_9ACTN|nr:DUF1593 domain-containing protein [Acrocarpospora pleiomorpha]GES17758.1 hypothetical protein Aple_006530 [Acrocarpospora pleiomorpha]
MRRTTAAWALTPRPGHSLRRRRVIRTIGLAGALGALAVGGLAPAHAQTIGSMHAAGAPMAAAGEVAALATASNPAATKTTRVVVTTDGEGDDQASMHRLLLYGNDLDIAAIVSSSSRWHWAGDPTANPPIPARRWSGTAWIPQLIDGGYRQVYPNLIKQDARYPSADALLKIVKDGNVTAEGEMAKDTPGSLLVKSILLDNDPRQVSLEAWGGTNTIAAALRSIEDQYANTPQWASVYKKIVAKANLYIIQDQDSTYKNYVTVKWPDLKTVMNRDEFEAFAYRWEGTPEPIINVFRKAFVSQYLTQGPYMASYPVAATGDWFSEGDSPALLHAIPTGLGNFSDPTYGGWGGRFVQINKNLWADDPRYLDVDQDRANDSSLYGLTKSTTRGLFTVTLTAAAPAGTSTITLSDNKSAHTSGIWRVSQIFPGNVVTVGVGPATEQRTIVAAQTTTAPYTITLDQPLTSNHAVGDVVVNYSSPHWAQARWDEAIQHDFAARAAWTTARSYSAANHAPVVSIRHTKISAKPGQRVLLTGTAKDPDRNALTYQWWDYPEAGTYKGGEVAVESSPGLPGAASFVVPKDAKKGDTIHIILQVSDDAPLSLTSYARGVVTVE